MRRLNEAAVDALAERIEGNNPDSAPQTPSAASRITIEELAPVPVWESDEELEEFLLLTYQERDRDR